MPEGRATPAHSSYISTSLGLNRTPPDIKDKCITRLPHDTWSKLTPDEIRARLPPRPGSRSLFKAVLRRLSGFQHTVESVNQSQILEIRRAPT